jgi:hypothetical protein
MLELINSGADFNDVHEAWRNKYGDTFVTKGFFNVRDHVMAYFSESTNIFLI